MSLHKYFSQVADELKRKSDKVRTGFSEHRPSAGDNREAIVADFLREHLPKAFGVSTGMVLSKSGEYSAQADVLIVDQLWNSPLYPTSPETIWLVEAVYALVEVKTQLSPTTLKDSVEKCRRFKSLARDFDKAPSPPRITDSLFIVWAFESASVNTAKESIIEALRDVPSAERPDFIIVPDKMIVTASSYFELTRLGQADSTYRAKLSQRLGGDINAVLGEGMEFLHLDSYSLFAWFLWLNSWLKAAGQRSAPLTSYLPSNYHFGSKI